jgi:DNA invertase Pin-like site-specific DNA recombinase
LYGVAYGGVRFVAVGEVESGYYSLAILVSGELDALLGDVRKGKVARIAVYKLDRLRRSLPHLAQIVAELAANGTALVCTSQGIDTSDANPAGRLQLGVLMAAAESWRTPAAV